MTYKIFGLQLLGICSPLTARAGVTQGAWNFQAGETQMLNFKNSLNFRSYKAPFCKKSPELYACHKFAPKKVSFRIFYMGDKLPIIYTGINGTQSKEIKFEEESGLRREMGV